jgi:hypothetical protein
MKRIKLEECTSKKLENLLDTKEKILFIAEEEFDTSLLKIINEKCGENTELSLQPNEENGISIALLQLIPNIQRLDISPDWLKPVERLNELSCLTNLIELGLGMYVKGNVSFEPIKHVKSLRGFRFDHHGLEHKTQYEFINQQQQLEKLQVKTLDLSTISDKRSLKELRIHSTLKNESLLAERFPKLKKIHLQGDSRKQDHSFIQNLSEIEDITINYNSYLTSFPTMKVPEKVKRICMLECYNFTDIDSLLDFENLEMLCLTTHNKSLQITAEDFAKLKRLRKLTTVYTNWGRGETPEGVEKIYEETGWKNSML